ncbi:MAG: 50S ribosomal protein L10 [Rhodospirillales bacterium]|nr:50S ribosomal protein L10 [Rhodospirillales bacterium]
MDRSQKEALVASMHQTFEETEAMVVTHYSGMTVAEITKLRGQMREGGASFKITKNRLTRLALAGTKYEGLSDLFTGPTAIAFSADPVAAAKVTANFAKDNEKLIILGGAVGEALFDAEGVKALASLPSLDQSRARIIGLLTAPAARIASLLQAPGGQIARVLGAYAQKGEAA